MPVACEHACPKGERSGWIWHAGPAMGDVCADLGCVVVCGWYGPKREVARMGVFRRA